MITGKLYFFTASILNWISVLDDDERKRIIIDSFDFLGKNKLARTSAFVIMPNHIHIIWQPLDDMLQLKFMKFTAQQIKFHLEKNNPAMLASLHVCKRDRKFQIWQRDPLAIELYSREVTEQKLDYIHNNPCQGKWLLCSNPEEYEFSSIRFYEKEEKNLSFLTHYMDILG